MKQFLSLFFLFLFFFVGCGKQKPVKERLCAYLNLDSILEMVPKDQAAITQMGTEAREVINMMLERLKKIPADKHNYDNTIDEYDEAKLIFIKNKQILNLVAALSDDTFLQMAASSELGRLSIFEKDKINQNPDLYNAFHNYYKFGSDYQCSTLMIDKFLEKQLQNLKRNGALLSNDKLSKISYLQGRINSLASDFYRNIRSNKSFLFDRGQLTGLDQQSIDKLKRDKNGRYILSLDLETFFDIIENCSVESTRDKIFTEFQQRGYPENNKIIKSLLSTRNQFAQILGYDDFSDYDLFGQMARNKENVEAFLWTVVKNLQKYEDQEFNILIKNLPENVTLTNDSLIKLHDESFIKASYRKKYFDVKESELAVYFQITKTVHKIMEVFERFFHFEAILEDLKNKNTWASDLICYKIRSLSNQRVIGYLFFDLYNRSGKNISGPSCMRFIPSVKDDCTTQCSGASVVLMNVKKVGDGQELLEFSQVASLFHEIGHALHDLYGAACFSDYSGTKVVRDFVEVPSEFAENFLEDRNVLKSISSHHKTGKKLSDDQINKVLRAQTFCLASRMLKQSFLALVSLALSENISDQDQHKVVEDIYKKVFRHTAYNPNHFFENSFIHFINYGSSYYTYVWSQVIADDLFDFVSNHGGLSDRKLGQKYIKDILAPGGFYSPGSMIKSFLGRNFSLNSFLKKIENSVALNYN